MWDPLGATIKVMYFSLWQQMSLFLILLYFTEKPLVRNLGSYICYNCKPKTTYTLCQVQHSISRTLLLHTIWCARGDGKTPSYTLLHIYAEHYSVQIYWNRQHFFSAYMQCTSTTKILAVLFLRGLFVNRADARAPLLACTTVQQPLSLTQSTSNCHLWQLQ